jgi:hypothetical protein
MRALSPAAAAATLCCAVFLLLCLSMQGGAVTAGDVSLPLNFLDVTVVPAAGCCCALLNAVCRAVPSLRVMRRLSQHQTATSILFD